MNQFSDPLQWKINLGTWFSTRVYVSIFFLLVIAYLFMQFGLAMGAMLSAVLFVSVLLHEFGHIFGSRATGGMGDEILIWPLGGLAMVAPAPTMRSKLITTAGGPAVNLLICLAVLPLVWGSPFFREALTPWQAPMTVEAFAEHTLLDNAAVLALYVNLLLLCINLVPACPLDGGQMTRTVLTGSLGNTRGMEWSIIVGFIAAIAMILVAWKLENVILTSLAFFLILNGYLDRQRLVMGEYFDDSFMGYDFSQGYTSLERSEEQKPQRKPGPIARWKAKRKAERQQKLEKEARENELQVDAILAKLHDQGMESLTEAEKRQLKRASSRYKDKDRTQE